jgi:ABC-type multidrug transport system ATPase subunit
MDHKIAVRVVLHSFGHRRILTNITFECNTGEIIGLFGRNGTGKTTLFKIMFGILKPDQAEIYFDGRMIRYGEKLTNFVGYHTQEIMLPRYTKTRDVISMYLPLKQQDKVFYAIGVQDMANKRICDLSLGQQRYLQLLLLLNLDHPFLILDEPFSMVEPRYKALIKEKLIEYRSQKGFIITDHYYRDVLEITDRTYLLKDGILTAIQKNTDLIDLGYLSGQAILD